jgi:hypothetical protein
MSKKAVASIRATIASAATLLDVERVKFQITNAAVTRVIDAGDRFALLCDAEDRERAIMAAA